MANDMIRLFLVPFITAVIVYALAQLNLLVMDRLIKVDIHRQARVRMSIWAFLITFVVVFGLMLAKRYYG